MSGKRLCLIKAHSREPMINTRFYSQPWREIESISAAKIDSQQFIVSKSSRPISLTDQTKQCSTRDCTRSKRSEKEPMILTQFDSPLLNVSSKNDCLLERSEEDLRNSSLRNDRQNFRDLKSPAKIDQQKLSTSGNDIILTQASNDESKKYSLRSLLKRGEISDQRTEVICEKTEIKVKVITPIKRAGIHWATLMKNNHEISVGSIVLAKMNTFWPWPAQIIRFNKSKAQIRFFGDLTTGSVSKKKLFSI